MRSIEKALLVAGIAVILVTNVVAAVQGSAGWLFLGVVVGLTLCGCSYILGNRRGLR